MRYSGTGPRGIQEPESQATYGQTHRQKGGRRVLVARHLIWIICAVGLAQPAFEVASIKPNRSGQGNSGFRRAGAGELNAINITLKKLIAYAYDVQDYQISGGPDWMDSERYNILAKPGTEPAPATGAGGTSLLRLRLQALLADRFQLSFHRATKELPIFTLAVGKNGPKLKAATASQEELLSNGHHLTCQKVSMAFFSKVFLQGELGGPVSDK